MFLWIIILILTVFIFALNISATNTVKASPIHTASHKRNYVLLIWLIPVFGVIAAMMLINRDIKKNRSNADEKIVNALIDFTDKINSLEHTIQSKPPQPQTPDSQQPDKKNLH